MRFALAHKATSYAMATCAWCALVLSGELNVLVSLLSLAGLIGSWWWEPPRIRWERWSIPWTVASSVVLALTVVMSFVGDFLIVGAEFLVFLLCAKLFNRRSPRDYQQVYIITFLMLVAGTVLNSEVTYGIFFLGYVVTSTWALILFHLRREMEDNFLLKHSDEAASERVEVARILSSRRVVGSRFFLGTSVVSLSVFLIATLLFLTIPRIGFGLFFQKNRSGLTLAGFSDGVRLDGHGTIKDDDTVVMRVEVADAYAGRRAPYLHWRGVAFDRYERGSWSRSREAPMTERQVTLTGGRERHHLQYDEPWRDDATLLARLSGSMRQVIYLEPIGYDVVFGASMPLAFEFEPSLGRQQPRRERNDEIRYTHGAGIKYVAYSKIESPAPEILRSAADRLPDAYQAYLQLPPEITDRVKQLAREITRDAPTSYDKAVAIESWLKSNLSYTLEMESPGSREPVDFFLFERKKGHCEYFSSAMAVLARSVGVPTRNVNGFLGGEWNEYDGYIAVRAGDAHSWVEVYFPDHGWVTFDPTPSAEVDRLGRGGSGVLARTRRFVDTLRFKWFKWVIEYDLYRQLSLFKSIGDTVRGGAGSVKESFAAIKRWLGRHPWEVGAVLLLVGAGITWLNLRRRRRGGGQRPGASGRRAARSAMAAIYAAVLHRLERRGLRRDPATTPREHAIRISAQRAPGAAAFAELTEIYYAGEYSGEVTAAMLARAAALGEAIELAFLEARKAQRRAS